MIFDEKRLFQGRNQFVFGGEKIGCFFFGDAHAFLRFNPWTKKGQRTCTWVNGAPVLASDFKPTAVYRVGVIHLRLTSLTGKGKGKKKVHSINGC